jgi:predicted Co/Zn/Cd cation transporter (cation efflux family)
MAASGANAEQTVLRHSLAMTALLAAIGVGFGLASGSLAIVFDGIGSSIDAAMTFLSLGVARLLARGDSRRFQFGYWHLEPMALAFNGGLLMLFCLYGLVTALGDLLAGGRDLDFGWAVGYAALASVLSLAAWLYERQRNRRIGSELIRLDAVSWLMSAALSAALLVAFGFALAVEGTALAWLARYADSAVLALLSAILAAMPVRMLREAWRDIFQIAPTPLDETVRRVMADVVARHGLVTYSSYVARVGRAQFIELHLVLPSDFVIGDVSVLDALRREIADAIGGGGPDRWLTIAFTGDERLI